MSTLVFVKRGDQKNDDIIKEVLLINTVNLTSFVKIKFKNIKKYILLFFILKNMNILKEV